MPAVTITKSFHTTVTTPTKGYEIYTDNTIAKGFGLLVTSKGAKSYILKYSLHGKKRRFTIGDAQSLDWQIVTTKAQRLRGLIAEGIDPQAVKTERVQEEKRLNARKTFREFADEYINVYAKRYKESWKNDQNMLNCSHLNSIKDMKLEEITKQDIHRIHSNMHSSPTQANRMHALIRKMFNIAIDWEIGIKTNPAIGIKHYKEHKRANYLTPKQFQKLVNYLNGDNIPTYASNCVKILCLTGLRANEVLQAEWKEISFANNEWVIPPERNKENRIHHVKISADLMQILKRMHKLRRGSKSLFRNADTGRPYTTIKKPWDNLRKDLNFKKLRIHDLRHTYASLLASSGHSLIVIGEMLNHSTHATTNRYKHLFDDPQKQAANAIGNIFNAAQNGELHNVTHLDEYKKEKVG